MIAILSLQFRLELPIFLTVQPVISSFKNLYFETPVSQAKHFWRMVYFYIRDALRPYNFTKSNTPPCVFFTFKWNQIASSISLFIKPNCKIFHSFQISILITQKAFAKDLLSSFVVDCGQRDNPAQEQQPNLLQGLK